MERLPLPYDLFLIAHGEKGAPSIHVPTLGAGLAAAMLADLALLGALAFEGHTLVLGAGRPGPAQLQDEACMRLLAAVPQQRMPIVQWLAVLSGDMLESTARQLDTLGLIQTTVRRRLIGTSIRYVPVGHGPLTVAMARVRLPVMGHEQPTPADLALCELVRLLRLEDALYLSDRPAEIRARLADLTQATQPAIAQIMKALESYIANQATAIYR
ncbi:GPP34 family phosphoprotein [Nonomuraea sediminis]|uniref:GPP34 family phosphoprotein n=1 Tax=Nonomuraea sediminis TaxID=2835864 RepID=UPI001BDDA3F9|nr:GPP34 family phosphoprotein [Nonomuraea sediminis]